MGFGFAAEAGEVAELFNGITYMQDMTGAICIKAQVNDSKQLYDARDGKSYWVTKLQDGNCWMTQNLALDLHDRTLTSNDSDVTKNWTSTTGTSILWSSTGQNDVKYYNPGNKYCPNGNCGSTSNISSNDGHDAQGNYYTFNAATAGTGQNYTTKDQDAPDSICPRGWRLPSNNSSVGATYSGLGLDSSNITKSPYYFVYSGLVNGGTLNGAGSYGYFWSSTANGSAYAYSLSFDSSTVSPSNSNLARYLGFSVRCVAR